MLQTVTEDMIRIGGLVGSIITDIGVLIYVASCGGGSVERKALAKDIACGGMVLLVATMLVVVW